MQSSLLGRSLGYADMARHARKIRRGNDEIVKANARVHLAARMGKLRGLPQKIGQMVGMSEDSQRAEAFEKLSDRAEPLPFTEIEPILKEAWGGPVGRIVGEIDPAGIAASLGQVHRVTLLDGTEVAVKVQYPGIREAVRADLKMLGWLSAPVGDLRRGFDLTGYREEIVRDLDEELDYRREAENQRRFAEMCHDMPEWIVPAIRRDLSTDKVLVSEWMDGDSIKAASQWAPSDRDALAAILTRGLMGMLFRHGLIHADPNPGNYRFIRTDAGPRVILYDFGSVFAFPPDHCLALLKLIEIAAARRGDPFKPLAALGFNEDLLLPIRGKLAALCGVILEPFSLPGKFRLSTWNRTQRVDDILGEDRWNFRMSGPPSLIFVMRAFKGLTYYLARLDVDAAWSIAVKSHLDDRRAELSKFDVVAPVEQEGTFDRLAQFLKIAVTEDGRQKVGLTFPAGAVDDIRELLDEELERRIAGQSTDIDAIARRVRRTAYAPQELFKIEEAAGRKGVRVWLE